MMNLDFSTLKLTQNVMAKTSFKQEMVDPHYLVLQPPYHFE